jgi:transposase
VKQDGRKLTKSARENLQKIAIDRVQSGEHPEDVIQSLGLSSSTIYLWLSKYRAGGWDALKDRKGLGGGRPRRISDRQLKSIYKAVTGGDPRQQSFDFSLWTRELVAKLIWKKFQIKLSRWSVGRLLKQLGLSCQKPLKRAYQRDPLKVERWLKKQFPQIKAFAKKVNATIYFGDEAGVRSDHQSGTTWGIKGETPEVLSNGNRVSLNMMSAISSKGLLKFMIINGRFNAGVFIDFIKRLLEGAKTPIILIVDGHPAHKAKKVKAFLKTIKDKFRMFFLPPYSPDLNPDELVWNDLKSNIIGRKVANSKEELKSIAMAGLRRIQKKKGRVASYFRKESTAYAA